MGRNTIIIYIVLVTLALFLSGCRGDARKGKGERQAHGLSATPVKDDGGEGVGSVYALLATLETEHISRGDSIHLSAPYLVRMWLKERAMAAYFSGQPMAATAVCHVPDVMRLLSAYGLYPYDAYPLREDYRLKVVTRQLQAMVDGARAHPNSLDQLERRIDRALDGAMGYLPANEVHFLGADYTPGEFARSVCAPGEYVRLVSVESLPRGSLSVSSTASYYPLDLGEMPTRNLELDSLTLHLRLAVERGHAVCWEGDTTNTDFRSGKSSWKTVGTPTADESDYRQRSLERLALTPDHAFAIVGMARKGDEIYYRCKNNQGEDWGEEGYVYLSESYLRRYTFALTMNQTAYRGEAW